MATGREHYALAEEALRSIAGGRPHDGWGADLAEVAVLVQAAQVHATLAMAAANLDAAEAHQREHAESVERVTAWRAEDLERLDRERAEDNAAYVDRQIEVAERVEEARCRRFEESLAAAVRERKP